MIGNQMDMSGGLGNFDFLKSQLITIFMLKGNTESLSLYSIIGTMILLSVLDFVFKIMPKILILIQNIFNRKMGAKFNKISSTINNEIKTKTSSILIERVYDGMENDIADSVLDFVTNYDGIKYVEFRKIYYVTHTDEVCIAKYKGKELFFKVVDVKQNSQNLVDYGQQQKTVNNKLEIERTTFEIYSYELSLTDLRRYLDDLCKNFKIQKLNKLGQNIYYFDEVIQPLALTIEGKIQYNNAPKQLIFNMTPFYTNKSLDNMFGQDVKLVMNRLRFFLNNKEWYAEKGIPYTFGVLLSGPPGCGKTSLVKAMANETCRHPINLKLHDFLTQTQINNLFFNDRIVINNDKSETFIIPQDKRLYSLDEIDCMSDIVLDRDLKAGDNKGVTSINDLDTGDDIFKELDSINAQSQKKSKLMKKMDKIQENTEKLNLGFLLNLFDGVLEIPGRIISMATNHPELIDKALVRPGRIDLIIDFKKTTRATIIEMYKHFYDVELIDDGLLLKFDEIDDYQYSPAEVNQIFFKYIKEPMLAVSELLS
jgi:hypothetical protein